jgi:hypothetical protein
MTYDSYHDKWIHIVHIRTIIMYHCYHTQQQHMSLKTIHYCHSTIIVIQTHNR